MANKKVEQIKWLEVKFRKIFDKKDINTDYSDYDKEYDRLSKEQCVKDKMRYVGFTDAPCVMMVAFKNENLAKWFMNTFDAKPMITPVLDYNDYKSKGQPKSKFSTAYLMAITNLFGYDDSASIKIQADYPMTIENNDMIIILAPRVGDD